MIVLIYTALTWVMLISLAFCTGILFFMLPAFSRTSPAAPSRDRIFAPDIRRLFGTALALIAAASIGELILRAADMSGRPLSAVLPVLPAVIIRSHYGAVWLIRAAALLALAFLALLQTRRDTKAEGYLMLGIAAVIAGTMSASGHAADQGDLTLRELADLAHLLAALVWGGGILVLSLVILPFLLKRGDLTMIALIAPRFSRVAGYAVLVLLLTALYNARVSVGSFEALWRTAYGLTVFAKMILFYFLILVGAFNRFAVVPLLQHVAGIRFEAPSLFSRLMDGLLTRFRGYLSLHAANLFLNAVLIEAVLLSAVLFCAALLRHEIQPSHLEKIRQQQQEQQQPNLPGHEVFRRGIAEQALETT